MSSITITCPQAGTNVVVAVQGSGSGAQGTICVCGTYTESLLLRFLKVVFRAVVTFFRWLFGLKALRRPLAAGDIIRVRVVPAGTPTPSPIPKQPGDVDISSPPANWCATG